MGSSVSLPEFFVTALNDRDEATLKEGLADQETGAKMLFHVLLSDKFPVGSLKRSIMINWLMVNGALMVIKDHLGRSPMHYAVALDDVHTVQLFLESGISLSLKDQQGVSPVDILSDLEKPENERQFTDLPKVIRVPWLLPPMSAAALTMRRTLMINEALAELVKSKDSFLSLEDPPSDFKLTDDLEVYANWCMACIEDVENLNTVRMLLSPSRMNDDAFWRKFLYHAELVKERLRDPNFSGDQGLHSIPEFIPVSTTVVNENGEVIEMAAGVGGDVSGSSSLNDGLNTGLLGSGEKSDQKQQTMIRL
eukprot:GFYU01008057.1.p1 GENE.GFYU01008057.1~~GFYU01008057.1.p1  ORF type:complete len:308 (-),score=49.86 GFYU01008057.1:29-952(-)